MSAETKFWDRHAEGYAKRPVSDEASYQHKLDITRGYLTPDSEVLEIGCGTGSTALVHAPLVRHIRATDFSAKMIEIAQRKAKADGVSNVTFEQAAIDDLHLATGSLDVVLALSVLHLLEDKETAIARVFDLLKPGGVFVTSTVCLGETMKFFKYIGPIGHFFRLLPIVKVFTPSALVCSLSEAGFEIDYQWQPGRGKAVFVVAKKPPH